MTTFRSNKKNSQMGSRSKPISAIYKVNNNGSALVTDHLYCNDKENQYYYDSVMQELPPKKEKPVPIQQLTLNGTILGMDIKLTCARNAHEK